MTGRHLQALTLMLVSALVLPESSVVYGRAGAVSGALRPVGKPRIPVHGSLTSTTVRLGDPEQIEIRTLPGTHIVMRVLYPRSGGFKKRGTSNRKGIWRHSWSIQARATGLGTIKLDFAHGKDTRHYTLHFTVAARATATPTPPATMTATSVPASSTPLARPTNTPGTTPGTATATPVSSATASPTTSSTAIPGTPQATMIPGTDIQIQSIAFYATVTPAGPTGAAQSQFSSTTPSVHAWVTFSVWSGTHDVTYNWYTPQGSLYATHMHHATKSGAATETDAVSIAGQDAANRPGQWSLVLVVDGVESDAQRFVLYSGAQPTTTSNTIKLDSLVFYAAVSPTGDPTQDPRISFPASTPAIYAYAAYGDWEGPHTATFTWYSPNGQVYTTYTDSSSFIGPSTDYSALRVQGTAAAGLPGDWRVDLTVDGSLVASQPFTVN